MNMGPCNTEVIMTDSPKTLTVPEAGARYFNLKRNASYAAAARGEIPTIRIGRALRVPIVALDRLLEAACKQNAAPDRRDPVPMPHFHADKV
jgi:excisionase family DNA binding protein